MAWVDTLTGKVEELLSTTFDERNGNVVPGTDTVSFNDAVKIDAAFLYADLAGSTKLAQVCPWQTTAKIIRAYLDICSRSITAHNGVIRSFDGDRVMGIFKGDYPNNNAVECAREIDWMVEEVLNPKALQKFQSIKNNSIHIKHCVGIDWGQSIAVRAGLRNSNDLIWIGRPPSIAAKLSDIRNYPYAVYITAASYNLLQEYNKVSGGIDLWEKSSIEIAGKVEVIYRTKYTRKP